MDLGWADGNGRMGPIIMLAGRKGGTRIRRFTTMERGDIGIECLQAQLLDGYSKEIASTAIQDSRNATPIDNWRRE